MEVKPGVTERGNELVIDEQGYTFRKKKVLKTGESFWTCSVKSCNAKVYTFAGGYVVSRKEDSHSHENKMEKTNRMIVSNSAKRKAQEDTSQRPSKIIHLAIEENVDALETLNAKDIACIRRNMYNSRRKKKPVLPRSREDARNVLDPQAVGSAAVKFYFYRVNLDVQQFRPSEIDVKVVDGFIVVEAKHEERADEHGYISREFLRRYKLPEEVDLDAISSTLSSDGVLTIEAHKKSEEPPSKERKIPITCTNAPAVTSQPQEATKKQTEAEAATEKMDQ